MIPTRVHGVLDYLIGLALIAAPWLLGFAEGGAETWIPVILGAGSILYSALTNYELGLAGILSMKAHLALDFVGGAFLATSPWLFDYADRVYLPHVVVGTFMVIASLTTKHAPAHPALDHRNGRHGGTVPHR